MSCLFYWAKSCSMVTH
uniref:Uncharacterized protein n=1 Tax=Anguilla anguilla TaxID=7936 RepID=A0A0E9P627_ANGAN